MSEKCHFLVNSHFLIDSPSSIKNSLGNLGQWGVLGSGGLKGIRGLLRYGPILFMRALYACRTSEGKRAFFVPAQTISVPRRPMTAAGSGDISNPN
jgi:hypothetical protein